MSDPGAGPAPRSRLLLGLAAGAVAFAAADTYVVVLALVDMMQGIGLSPEQLQRAAPIVSGFLLGYVAMLPLIGRIADLRGRVPVLTAALVVFAFGSILTAAAYDMTTMVGGRFLQGVGGGGLVPATLALVADLYPVHRRAIPLGIVSAVQEIGSVLGPLLGAVVLAVADWRAIFLLNLAVGLVLAAAIAAAASREGVDGRGASTASHEAASPPVVEQRGAPAPSGRRDHLDWLGILLLLVAMAAGGLVFQPPTQLLTDLTWGQLFIPFVEDGGRWLTPIGAVAIAAVVLLLARTLTARRPLVDLRAWGRSLREADLVGATYLAVALGGVILAFATADPKIEVFSEQGWWYLLGAAIGTVAFVVHLRRAEAPLLPRGTLAARPAWGSVVVSFFVGTALIAALIDVPLFARTTVYPESQLMAALVLLRFLAALPVGAVVGGFGFGLALAPVNAAILASTADAVHGVASAMVVVARMVGMLVGISALTTIGLRRYYAEQAGVPPVQDVCPAGTTRCSEYSDLLKAAGIAQEQTVFLGAAGCALVAAVLALVLLRGAATRGTPTRTGLGIG